MNSLSHARHLDLTDPLKHFRDRFHIPKHNNQDVVYLSGNSLGLQPKTAKQYFEQELKDWATLGVEAHFQGKNPWFNYHEWFSKPLANIVGAKPGEVVVMNNLTVNLHLLLVSFYRPEGKRRKIIFEETAFPSDRYALESQVRFHGLDPAECLIELKPSENAAHIETAHVLDVIEKAGDELALVMLGGVNYFSGQLFDLKKITHATHNVGAIAGYDLAHAAGNVPLSLHDWNVDFACWCSYKYLNSGPGGVAGIFVNEKYGDGSALPRFHGWWGNDAKTRFQMAKEFNPAQGAEGWQLSNAPIFNMIGLRASLEIFEEAGFANLRAKSEKLTAYLESLLNNINQTTGKGQIHILTPANPAERGCQLSVRIIDNGLKLFDEMTSNGFLPDWRQPDVIRFSPVPLYNTFEDVWKTANFIEKYFEEA